MRVILVTLLFLSCGDDGAPPARKPGSCDGPCPASKINHLIVIVQENHSFDSYFARYCTAAPGSNPTCSTGPACCEAGPAHDPSGASPIVLDDAANAAFDRDHNHDCEVDEIDGGRMDRFVTSTMCGDPRNFAYADATTAQPYWQLAAGGALADRYFQPLAGASSANDMYLARATFVFNDNQYEPEAIGKECSINTVRSSFDGQTIADLLIAHGNSWGWYSEGYQAMVDARAMSHCPTAAMGCGLAVPIYPCLYDPSDDPFTYYTSVRDNPAYMHDYTQLARDLAQSKLPQVAFVKSYGFRSEHPGYENKISDGIAWVSEVLAQVASSPYAADTLILLVYDEGGGFFDHIPPPADSTVDGKPYGTRVPLLALGPLARKNFLSHVTMEHSSIVKFIEWNWLGMQTGQLGTRDAVVSNIGSLVDPAVAGTVPEN